jgi:hypothetical protein
MSCLFWTIINSEIDQTAVGHFGMWVIGTDQPEKLRIEALDGEANIVGVMDHHPFNWFR